ncbi:UDP-2,4-diacetamido-2,4,6-trideoxy-beta-L-altropyranose hydrolase [Chloroflexus sp. Y-396-1]|uniref:UDP-2,4-diacetamido-2,4, 6-trideoxy-beta-L-altropyranose hydrolase n=1 Tax=Chloroflexus sp. Y-396-1 TaxID=867845 RepID=UPI0004B02026|nr:UDP-2,4-diacetamido-2,4,6-trideoxy-beta-L-altropyranose hydrolase [Chloroflexus sp. Y-396-1]
MGNWVNPLLIRTDASVQIGTGHLMRCLALAQAWQDAGGQAVFLMAIKAPALESRLQSEGMEIVHLSVQSGSIDDAIQTSYYAHQVGADWIVVDGYHFGTDYQRIIKNQKCRLLLIDDLGSFEYCYADLILNQNVYAHEELYRNREPYTQLLLGTRYALLRREFLKWRGWKREIPDVARKVLVTMGGSDPDNVTLKVIQALQQVDLDGLEAIVVVGGSNPHYEELQSAVQDARSSIRLESNVTNMPELMAWADVAISGGGSTSWELAFMGVPTLTLILASNQRSIAEHLDTMGVVVNLGWYIDVSSMKMAQILTQLLRDPKTRAKMSQCGRQLVDGEGAARVLMDIRDDKLRLRRVREDDCRLLWEWANEKETRASSFSSDPIPWDKHVQWFTRKLLEPNCFFFIAVNRENAPIGQVRFDIDTDGEAEISINIDKDKRGLGYGTLLISKAVNEVFRLTHIRSVHAFIKPNNEASIRAFERAGFKRLSIENIRGNVAIHYIRTRNSE